MMGLWDDSSPVVSVLDSGAVGPAFSRDAVG